MSMASHNDTQKRRAASSTGIMCGQSPTVSIRPLGRMQASRAFIKTPSPQWAIEPEVLARADQLPDDAIWSAHQEAKRDLLSLIKRQTGTDMRSEVPLIAFARRMTEYKRPDLLFAELGRLKEIAQQRPFQIVCAARTESITPRTSGNDNIEAMRGVDLTPFDWARVHLELLLENLDIGVRRVLPAIADPRHEHVAWRLKPYSYERHTSELCARSNLIAIFRPQKSRIDNRRIACCERSPSLIVQSAIDMLRNLMCIARARKLGFGRIIEQSLTKNVATNDPCTGCGGKAGS